MPYKDPDKNKQCKSEYAKSPEAKEKMKAYYEKNKEQILARDKEAKLKKLASMSDEEKQVYIEKRREQTLRCYYKNREKYLENNKKTSWKRALKYLYDITYEQYLDILKQQDHKCAICKCSEFENRWTSKNLPFAVDHCHTTGIVRGLLCDNCNVMIGHAKESKEVLQSAIQYLDNDKRGNGEVRSGDSSK